METRGQTQNSNGDGSGDGSESSSGDENGGENGNENGNEGRIGEGGGEVKKRKKPRKSCRHYVGNECDLDGKKKNHTNERVGPVAANPYNLENNKKAVEGAQGTQGLSKNVQVERVCPPCRV